MILTTRLLLLALAVAAASCHLARQPDAKLILSWLVGPRTQENFTEFMHDVRSRVTQRIQLTTDGHGMYLTAVRAAFRFDEVNYAQLVKKYGQLEPALDSARRYSPPVARVRRRSV
jgi:hypothetical protein